MCRARREPTLYQEGRILTPSRWVSAAFEDLLVKPQLSQPVAHCVDVAGLAIVRRARESQLFIGEPKLIGRATFDYKNRLQGLDRRPRVDHSPGITHGYSSLAIAVNYRNCAPVPTLHHFATGYFHQNRVFNHDG